VFITTNSELPEGTLVRTVGGGIEALKQVLFKLKKFKFSGYIKTKIKRDKYVSEGNLVVREGAPVAAIYGRRTDGPYIKTKEGEDALKLIWGDTYDHDCSIIVYGRVDIDEIIRKHPEALVNLVEKVAEERKRKSAYSLSWGAREKAAPKEPVAPKVSVKEGESEELKKRLEDWRSRGYIVRSLEESLDDLGQAKVLFKEFEENVKRIESLRSELEGIDGTGYETEMERIRAMLKNPGKVKAIESAMAELKESIKEKGKGTEHPKEEPEAPPEVPPEEGPKVQVEVKEEPPTPVMEEVEELADDEDPLAGLGRILPPDKDESDRCSVCGANMHAKDECPTCGARRVDTEKIPEKELGKSLASKEANLIPEFTFASFVVGEGNRFSHAASLAVSKVESSAYNPLFITGGAGLGKTHLMNAIGNYVLDNFKDKRVLYITVDKFINEFIEANKMNKMAMFREKYRDLDFLLMDDVHFIADREEVQDELFHTFNELYKNGKQIVMTSDRPLRSIQGLNDRLISRFQAGLVTDIKAPDLELRMGILRKKLEKTDIAMEEEVLGFIAKRYTRNIRKLEGALGTLIAYCELMKKSPTIEAAIDALKEEPPDTPEDLELIPAIPTKGKLDELKTSHSYLIEENRPVKSFKLFVDKVNQGFNGMALTRLNPKRINELYDVGDATILWLTDREGDPDVKIPPVLEKIIYRIEDLLNSPGKTILLIDGLDYLISNNSFDPVLRFLRRLIDEVSESEAIFVMSIAPETIDEQGLKILEREMEIISFT
jgi:chromosomal replication initiator protein DnaA